MSLAFTEALREAGITGSIGSVGDALDNALMESTIGLFTTEVIDQERPTWRTWRHVEQATASWVHWYNHEHLHSSIGDIPPAEYEDEHYQGIHERSLQAKRRQEARELRRFGFDQPSGIFRFTRPGSR